MSLSKTIHGHLVGIPAGAHLASVDVHEDPDYAPDTVGALCEFDSGDMFLLSVPLCGRPFDAAMRSEIASTLFLIVAISHGLRVPELSHV